MVSAAPSLGIGPCAPPTTQAVSKLVTSRPQNAIFYPSSFQSLAHSFENENSTTRLLSEGSALFVQNTGGRYLSHDLPLVFKDLRTLAPNGEREGVTPLAPRSLFEGAVSERGSGYVRGFTASPHSLRPVLSLVNSCSLLRFFAICRRRCPVGAPLLGNGKRLLFPYRVIGHHLLSAPRVPLWSSNLLPCYPWGINHV
jgi:hypothetical protein